jgi:2-phosphoglycerate kinase
MMVLKGCESMIYILAGIAKSGKSIVSQSILKNHQIPVISTDQIMMMIHYGNPQLKLDINASDDTVSRKLEPYLYGLIKSLSSSKKNTLIEGVHFRAEFVHQLMKQFPNQIHAVFLGYKDQNAANKAHELDQNRHLTDNCWYGHMNQTELLNLSAYMIEESKRIYHECQTFGQTYIEIVDIIQQKESIIEKLIQSTSTKEI